MIKNNDDIQSYAKIVYLGVFMSFIGLALGLILSISPTKQFVSFLSCFSLAVAVQVLPLMIYSKTFSKYKIPFPLIVLFVIIVLFGFGLLLNLFAISNSSFIIGMCISILLFNGKKIWSIAKNNYSTFIVFGIFSILVYSLVWGRNYHDINASENLLMGNFKDDVLFHSTISQMIKNFWVPSIAVDGIKFLHYHWGGHWLVTSFSTISNISPYSFYNIGYPIVFIPLFFQQFLLFIYLNKRDSNTFKLSLLVLLLLFFGFEDMFSLWEINLSTKILFSRESQLISTLFTFILINTSISVFYSSEKKLKRIFLFLALPILVFIITITKISSGFFLPFVLIYLILRLQLYKKIEYILSFFILGIILYFSFLLIHEFDGNSGLNNKLFLPVTHILVSNIWIILSIIIIVLKHKLFSLKKYLELIQSSQYVYLEVLIGCSFMGIIVLSLLNTLDNNGIYFTEFIRWFSFAYFLVLVNSIDFNTEKLLKKLRMVLIFVLTIGVSYKFTLYVQRLVIKSKITEIQCKSNNFETYTIHKLLKCLSQIPKEEIKTSVLYIPKSNCLYWDCSENHAALSFLVQSQIGIPLIDGLPEIDNTQSFCLSPYFRDNKYLLKTDEEVVKKAKQMKKQLYILQFSNNQFYIQKIKYF